MRRFIARVVVAVGLFVLVVLVMALAVPADRNAYLQAYNMKLALLDTVPSPRIIFVGGSNLAFGLDSHRIQDSLGCHVVNMGLHGGLGIRLPMCDVLEQLRAGDVVVLQMEYGNFCSGGNGEPETLPQLMVATKWRHIARLNAAQWQNVVIGLPRLAAANAKRLVCAALGASLDSPNADKSYSYVASSFNDLGDEVSHWRLPPRAVETSAFQASKPVDGDFIHWLDATLLECERRGATVVLLPPICPETHFRCCYNVGVSQALDSIGRPYAIMPQAMAVPDDCAYNGGYHVNYKGVETATLRIIAVMKRLAVVG